MKELYKKEQKLKMVLDQKKLKIKQECQQQIIQRMYQDEKISPKSYQHHQMQLEKWVDSQNKKIMQRSNNTFYQGTSSQFGFTKRDIQFFKNSPKLQNQQFQYPIVIDDPVCKPLRFQNIGDEQQIGMLSDQLVDVILREMVGEMESEKCYGQFMEEVKKQIVQKNKEQDRIRLEKEREMDVQSQQRHQELKQIKNQLKKEKDDYDNDDQKDVKKEKKQGFNNNSEVVRQLASQITEYLSGRKQQICERINKIEVQKMDDKNESIRFNSRNDIDKHKNIHQIQVYDYPVLQESDFTNILQRNRQHFKQEFEIDAKMFGYICRLVFDSFNSSLDKYRVFKNNRIPNLIQKQFNKVMICELDKIFENISKQLVDQSKQICGYIPDKLNEKQQKNNNPINEKHLIEIREERMVKAIKKQILENDQDWQNFEDEKYEIMLQMSDHIFEHLLQETVQQLQILNKTKA